MRTNDLPALRNHLFEVIERLKLSNDPDADEKEKMDVETAKAITNAAQSIIHSAKIEIDLLKIISNSGNQTLVRQAITDNGFLIPIKTENQ
jgi:hypothetical protein